MHLSGNYTEENLKRVALSMDLGTTLEKKLVPSYVGSEEEAPFKIHLGHRNVDWSDQIEKGVRDVREQGKFLYCSGRKVKGYRARNYVDLRGLRKFFKKQSRELKLYIQETYA